jgi:hypothetical protein
MGKWMPSWMLLLALLVMVGAIRPQVAGLTTPPAPTNAGKPGDNHAAIDHSPACQRILAECRRVGFVYGEWKKDNGLWRDCFGPVVNGGTVTREGKDHLKW